MVHCVTRGMEPSVVSCRISAKIANMPTAGRLFDDTGMPKMPNSTYTYYQRLRRQKDIADTYPLGRRTSWTLRPKKIIG